MTYTDANKSDASDIGNSARSTAPHHRIAQCCIHIELEQSAPSIDGHPLDATEAYYVVPGIAPLSLSSNDSAPPMEANARNTITLDASAAGNTGSVATLQAVVDDWVRERDADHPADSWDVDTGEFVTLVPKPVSSGKAQAEALLRAVASGKEPTDPDALLRWAG